MSFPIIHINGYPGVGKLTIAQKLVDLLSPSNGKLIHNHLLIDPPLRRTLRSVFFDALVKSHDTMVSVIAFTDFQSNDALGRSVIAEYLDMAARRHCSFVPSLLSVVKRRTCVDCPLQNGSVTENVQTWK
ncbi:hypothetical protein HYE67_004601 [Fusarium culmorum]|uniref:Uncharacterized protein n=1 Tax=Fusarium culmorum TaxID=5516 RepID=A0A2T4GQJ7_FUSCU|nr:hypothetical protein FCULG_00001891 [Fusarium culmorum]QPC62370.1 hypothetical protein HYE67_004601 [Fusarium culmorum]